MANSGAEATGGQSGPQGRGPALPKRSRRYGVGKEIGGAVYLHREYEGVLGQVLDAARLALPDHWNYTVVKYSWTNGAVSFIQSPDFDAADEPMVGDIWTVYPDGTCSHRKQARDPYIYHHKWLFVEDGYAGFSVEESKARSRAWMRLPDVDRTRIGRKSYWEDVVLPRLAG